MSKTAYIIDVESGNLQSLQNAVETLGWTTVLIKTPADLEPAFNSSDPRLFLPGVGNFGHFMIELHKRGFAEPIKKYIDSGKRLMGICVGLQSFMNESEESPSSNADLKGLGLINRKLFKFDDSEKSVPHIGWNRVVYIPNQQQETTQAESKDNEKIGFYGIQNTSRYYFVNSYATILTPEEAQLARAGKIDQVAGFKDNKYGPFDVTLTTYGSQTFVSALGFKNVFLTQYHPEKCGQAGLKIIQAFLDGTKATTQPAEDTTAPLNSNISNSGLKNGLTARIVACLDVRANDNGDLVVTKGDQYDVRERQVDGSGNPIRNLGKPVSLCKKYYDQGADEVTFLNITSFRNSPLKDLPMLQVLREASKTVFVPLTVGGGIRDTLDPETNTVVPALDVAALYFRSGADKVSIGSDAVTAAEEYYARGEKGDGKSPIETISKAYGAQAVVISVDPRKVFVNSAAEAPPNTKLTEIPENADPRDKGPNGEKYVWYQCTIKGGREARPIGVYEFVRACEALGAGEILLNSIDRDGSNRGYDLQLIDLVKSAVKIPVIASSGAGTPDHFVEAFEKTNADAALGAGMFHREEYTVNQIKDVLKKNGIPVRRDLD